MGTAKIHWLTELIQLSYVNVEMKNSAEENNPWGFPGNKTGGTHYCKSFISLPPKKEKTQHKTKQKLAITKNVFSVRSRRLRSFQLQAEPQTPEGVSGDFYLSKQVLSEKLLILPNHTINQISRKNKILSLQEHTDSNFSNQ